MICIQCTHPVRSLYTSYSPTNIRLTTCPACNKFADKYIEYDGVLIFIDLLLLRPSAYRHFVFNILTPDYKSPGVDEPPEEERQLKETDKEKTHEQALEKALPATTRLARFFARATQLHPQTIRIWVLITLFDVYLTWARAEQHHTDHHVRRPFTYFLTLPVLAQYFTFLLYCVMESAVSHMAIQAMAAGWLGWADPAPLATVLVISSSSKLFPILMVIWSYDVPLASTVLGWAVSFNTIEALAIILDCAYWRAIAITVVAAMARLAVCEYAFLELLEWVWKTLGF